MRHVFAGPLAAVVVAFGFVLMLPGPAHALGLGGADTNHDGKISRAEAEAAQDRTFKKLDTNGNGSLSFSEFAAGQPGLPAHPTRADRQRRKRIIHQWFNQIDTNGNGRISMKEYRKAVMPYFNRLDTNHNGELSAAELRAAFGHVPAGDHGPSSPHASGQ